MWFDFKKKSCSGNTSAQRRFKLLENVALFDLMLLKCLSRELTNENTDFCDKTLITQHQNEDGTLMVQHVHIEKKNSEVVKVDHINAGTVIQTHQSEHVLFVLTDESGLLLPRQIYSA